MERFICPDGFITADFMLARLNGLLAKLVVYPENMKKNLNKLKGLIFSQQVLLRLTQKGVSREDSYRIVQKCAMEVWEGRGEFRERLLEDSELCSHLTRQEIDEIFGLNYHLEHVDTIFERVFGREGQ